MFNKNDRIAIQIDGHALFTASRAIGMSVDFANLRKDFAGRGRLLRAYYYTAIDEEAEYTSVRKLADWLGYNGYFVRTRPLRKHTDSDGNIRVKANMNMEMAMDARDIAERIDHLILFNGDRDMIPLVESMQRLGVRVSACSTRRSEIPFMSDELRRTVDNFIELEDLREIIDRGTAR